MSTLNPIKANNVEMDQSITSASRLPDGQFKKMDTYLNQPIRTTNVSQCSIKLDKNDPDANNGLITKIWGPPSWESFHSITFGYPIEPTDQQKEDYMNYFIYLGKVLPCIYCRRSYQQFITEGDTILIKECLAGRKELTHWGYRLHEAVNKKLDVRYGVTYEELCDKYESYRARCTKTEKGCVTPLNMKAQSYRKSMHQRAPIIELSDAIALKPHAHTLGLNAFDKILERYSKIERNSEQWIERDNMCRKIIRYMRKNGIDSLDSNGLPSADEMILISMLCTNLEEKEIKRITKELC